MALTDNQRPASEEDLSTIKHDIKNQLSSIHLAIAQLRYEVENPTADCVFYMETIATSCANIDRIIENIA
jgi:hypothetical protein